MRSENCDKQESSGLTKENRSLYRWFKFRWPYLSMSIYFFIDIVHIPISSSLNSATLNILLAKFLWLKFLTVIYKTIATSS